MDAICADTVLFGLARTAATERTLAHRALASTFGSFFPGVAVLCPTRSGAGHKKRGFKFYEPRMARITRILKTDLIRVIRAIRGSI